VQGILIDERTWAIRYLIVNTSNWWLGHEVLIAPAWIKNIIWADSKVTVDLTRQQIKGAPPYICGIDESRARSSHSRALQP